MTATVSPRSITVPVEGGDLHARVWGDQPDVVVGIHGITASAISLQPVADRLSDRYTVVAPDLRGRGRSAGLPGPFGMKAHTADVVALLDHLDVAQASILGESMGGYVAVQLAVSHPERVQQLHLIDGGLPLPVPEGLDPDTFIEAILGPSLQRLDMTFESREAYHDYWRVHPALQDDAWNPYVEAYLDDELTGEPPHLKSVVSQEAVRADGRDQLTNEDLIRFEQITCPVTLVRAPRNLANEPAPLFPDETVEACRRQMPQLIDVLASDTNHYTLVLTPEGADQIANAVLTRQRSTT